MKFKNIIYICSKCGRETIDNCPPKELLIFAEALDDNRCLKDCVNCKEYCEECGCELMDNEKLICDECI